MKVPSEHQEQVQVCAWLDGIAALRWPHLAIVDGRLPYFAVPNGGNRNAITGAKLKCEGVRAGVPDLVLMIARRPFHGLLVEMKRIKGGVISPAQDLWFDALPLLGYDIAVCEGHVEAIEVITDYLDLTPGPDTVDWKKS